MLGAENESWRFLNYWKAETALKIQNKLRNLLPLQKGGVPVLLAVGAGIQGLISYGPTAPAADDDDINCDDSHPDDTEEPVDTRINRVLL